MALSAERKAQLEQLKDDAAALGVKVKTGFLDDWLENLIIVGATASVTVLVTKLFFC